MEFSLASREKVIENGNYCIKTWFGLPLRAPRGRIVHGTKRMSQLNSFLIRTIFIRL